MPYARLDMRPDQLAEVLKVDNFLGVYARIYQAALEANSKTRELFMNMTRHLPPISNLAEYGKIFEFMRSMPEKILGNFVRIPSEYEPFQSDYTQWLSDDQFAQQRLAGSNPMSLQRITFGKHGLKWDKLKKTLNPSFNWEAAVQRAIGRDNISLRQAIQFGYLFALRFPLCDDMVQMPDISETNPERKMRPFLSPIALFATVTRKNKEPRLMPVAIQIDYKPKSDVFTPNGDKPGLWTIAKLNVQITDLAYSQIVEHLAEVHLTSEVFCVSLYRHISKRHPLYQMMQYHCRGVIVPNTFGGPTLISPQQYTHKLFPFGYKGTQRLVADAAAIISWDNIDLRKDLVNRGVTSKLRLPYYPYRDDGLVILKAIENLVTDYVDLYYKTDEDIAKDSELQVYISEISADGKGEYGGLGKVRNFPRSLKTKAELMDVLSRVIWLMSGQHSAIGYPAMDYSTYLPNAPTRLYDDPHVPKEEFSSYMLSSRPLAAFQGQFTLNVASMRFDRLFDYGPLLEDPNARALVYQHYCRLSKKVEPLLQKRNLNRKKNGFLTYPYMLPRWLTNGIQI